MAILKIAPESVRSYELLFALSEETLSTLLSNLEKVEWGPSPSKLAEQLSASVQIAPGHLEQILQLVVGLNTARFSSGFSPERIADDLAETLNEFDDEDLKPSHRKNYLLRILSVNGPMMSTLRARELLYDREKILQDSDVITDIRPIFDGIRPNGLLILQTLKIEYSEDDGRIHQIYLALDKDDLRKLAETIQRAESQEKSIKAVVSGASFIEM